MTDDKDYDEDWKDFLVARSLAINEYAAVENSLNDLFSRLLRTDHRASAIVFYKVPSGQRRATFKALISLRYEQRFKAFWKGVEDEMEELDRLRNSAVHWHIVNDLTDDGYEIQLKKPAFWTDWSESKLTTEDLTKFAARARFFWRTINMFVNFNDKALPTALQGLRTTWEPVFGAKYVYPPAEGHPWFGVNLESGYITVSRER